MFKKKSLAIVFSILSGIILLINCGGGGSSGGSGADFDATKYYTKTEVDDMVKDIRDALPTVKNASLSVSSNLVLANNSYANGAYIGTSDQAVPLGVIGALYRVTQMGSATHTGNQTIYVGNGTSTEIIIIAPLDSSQTIYIYVPYDNMKTGTIRWWLTGDVVAGDQLKVDCMMAFREVLP
jgi:hypothetical protein